MTGKSEIPPANGADEKLPRIEDCPPLEGRRVLLRLDLNAPLDAGRLRDDSRLRAVLPTLRELRAAGAAVLILSHLGRPPEGAEGAARTAWSLAPVAARLSELLQSAVPLVSDWLEKDIPWAPGEVLLAENIRFLPGEIRNDDDLARRMGALCEVYINDAFSVSHREHASTCGVLKYAPRVCAGPGLLRELDGLEACFRDPARPLVAVVGGAKLESKLGVLHSLLGQVDHLLVGGLVGAALLAVSGRSTPGGLDLDEVQKKDARKVLEVGGERLLLPEDAVCARSTEASDCQVRRCGELRQEELVLDIGPATAERFSALVRGAGTVLWSGPLGLYEQERFAAGTRALAAAVAASEAYSVVGGGDTLAALVTLGYPEAVSFASTGGGAFLSYLRDRNLPALKMLRERMRALRAMERARDL